MTQSPVPDDAPLISLVIPAHDERDNIGPLIQAIDLAVQGAPWKVELILVDDGSRDGTFDEIERHADRHPWVRGLSLSRNFGQQAAVFAGLHFASGSAVITMDADLQHPPEMIEKLVKAWRDGFKVVLTRRRDGAHSGRFKRWSSRAFYSVFSRLSGVDLSPGTGEFRLMDRDVVELLLKMGEHSLFLRGAVAWTGFRRCTLDYQSSGRRMGRSSYSLFRMVRLAQGALVSFSTVPLRLGIWLGVATSGFAFLELCYILVQFCRGKTVPGWASTVGIMSLLFGILFLLLGLIGLYLAEIHRMLTRRPRFLIERKTNQ